MRGTLNMFRLKACNASDRHWPRLLRTLVISIRNTITKSATSHKQLEGSKLSIRLFSISSHAKLGKRSSFLDCFMTSPGECTEEENKPSECKDNEGEQPKQQVPTGDGINIQLRTPFKLHNLSDGPAMDVNLTIEAAQRYYTQMQTIRRMELAAASLYKEKVIRGFCHLYSGEEACAVGMKAAMRDVDGIITAYRCHGWSYLMDISVLGVLAELTGRQSGCQRGKGGSMHMYSKNYYGGNGIVGAQVPVGAGVALASQYTGSGGVCLSIYGDGAANQGQVFEAYNMAYLWKLPCIFVCENNNYAMGTSTSRGASNTNYYTRGDVLPGIWVDGMNVLAVRSATEFAIDYVAKNGPLVLETNTYRYSGHSMSDPGTSYRTRDEIQEVRLKRDPISTFRDLCADNGLMTPAEMKEIDAKINQEIDQATKKAREDSEIPVAELTGDVYAACLEPKIRGVLGYNLVHLAISKEAKK